MTEPLKHLVFKSLAMRQVLVTLKKLTKSPEPILLVGPRGSGKDTIALLVHSLWRGQSFWTLPCDLGYDELRRSLLGYLDELKAEITFSPDEAYVPGLLEQAEGGTLYLDRLDLISQLLVTSLYAVLQGQPFTPLGTNTRLVKENVRFVASCSESPFPCEPLARVHPRLSRIFEGRVVRLPNLGDRDEDLAPLALHFAKERGASLGMDTPRFSQSFFDFLHRVEWPNNLWDLMQFMHHLVASCGALEQVDANTAEKLYDELARGRPCDAAEHSRRKRCGRLAEGLVYQQQPITGEAIYGWISQFSMHREASRVDPRDLAEQLITRVRYKFFYNGVRIRELFQQLIVRLVTKLCSETGWSWVKPCSSTGLLPRQLLPHVVSTNPYGPMKSSEALNYTLRVVAGLKPDMNTVQFDSLADYVNGTTKALLILFMDDFIGTGQQASERLAASLGGNSFLMNAIKNKVGRSIPIRFYLLVCVAFAEGLKVVKDSLPDWLPMDILAGEVLGPEAKVFSNESLVFPDPETRREAELLMVDRIGRYLYPPAPAGFGDIQSAVVFEHNTPNDSLPVLWKEGYVDGVSWKPLFPRAGVA